MSENVIALKDFKKPEFEDGGNTVILMLYFTPFFNEKGEQQRHSMSIPIGDGNYQAVIDAIIKMGGIYAPEIRHGKVWFYPWPPAALSVHVIDAETGETIQPT